MPPFVIGLDFGTNSCRSLLVDVETGREVAGHVFPYPSGTDGVILDPSDPNLARQNPADYLSAIEETIREAIRQAKTLDPGFDPKAIIGIGVDTTGSSCLSRIRKHIRELSEAVGESAGEPADMILDLRVQPGGMADAQQLVKYGEGWQVTVRVKEF